jgi:seryl-tRNA synthetase
LPAQKKHDQLTTNIKQKFDASDHYATRTWGLVQEQERDIREMKGRLEGVETRLDTQDEKLNQILERLPNL